MPGAVSRWRGERQREGGDGIRAGDKESESGSCLCARRGPGIARVSHLSHTLGFYFATALHSGKKRAVLGGPGAAAWMKVCSDVGAG